MGIPLLDLAERRLSWAERRQTMLAENIANSDTPGWRPRDMAPFADVMQTAMQSAGSVVRTDPSHLAGTVSPDLLAGTSKSVGQAPDGNAVSIDQELHKIADTDTSQSLVTAIYKSYLGLFRTALGQNS